MAVVAEKIETANLQTHLLVPKLEIYVAHSGNICHDERKGRSRYKDIAAGCMAAQSLTRGVEHAVGLRSLFLSHNKQFCVDKMML